MIITDPLFYFLAVPAVIILGLAKGGFAGVGTASTPLLALYLPPLEAAALMLPLLLMQDAISVWWYRHDWDAWNLRVLLPGAICGMSIAWLLAAYVTDAEVRLIVGAIGLSFVTYSFLRRKPKPHKRSALTGTFWGALSGFTTFMAQAGGPPLQVHILPQRMAKLKLVGTTTIFYAVVNSLKIVPYFSLGQFTSKNFVTSLMLVPLAFASNFFGIWLVERTPEDTFYRIAYLLVLLISIALVWQGANGMLHG